MTDQTDALDAVRESRIRMSREANNDPATLISRLRELNGKYAKQIEAFRSLPAKRHVKTT